MTYGRPAGTVADIVALGRFLQAMLGATPSLWQEAETAIGPVQTAIAVIYVLQLYEDDVARHGSEGRIRNPGGYLRAFIRMVANGEIDLTSDLLTMRRRRLTAAPASISTRGHDNPPAAVAALTI